MSQINACKTLGAWLLGHVPKALVTEIEKRHPTARVVGLRRGFNLDLEAQDPALFFVLAPEIRCWIAVEGDPDTREGTNNA